MEISDFTAPRHFCFGRIFYPVQSHSHRSSLIGTKSRRTAVPQTPRFAKGIQVPHAINNCHR